MGIITTSSPGDGISSNLERTAPGRRGEEPGYVEVLQQRTGSLNIKRLLMKENQVFQRLLVAQHKEQISQDKGILSTFAGSSKKQESSRKRSTSALLTMPKPLTVGITINCGKF